MNGTTKTVTPAGIGQEQAGIVEWNAGTSEGAVETTSSAIAEPASPPDVQKTGEAPWLWAALGLALVLIGCVLWYHRSEKKKTEEPTAAEPASEERTGGIAPAVIWELGAREDQQDAYGMSDPARYDQQGMIAIVADGMGGLSNGGMISSALVRSCISGYEAQSPQMQPKPRLLELLTRANEQVNRMIAGRGQSGSTLVMAMIKEGYLDFLTVGDSHIYLCRGGGLILLNREHIYRETLALRAVNHQIAPGQIETDRQKKSLTSYLGLGQLSYLDRNCERIKLLDEDQILLCSDGVFGTLSGEDVERALSLRGQAAADALREMVNTANRPHQDNFTAVILEYHG